MYNPRSLITKLVEEYPNMSLFDAYRRILYVERLEAIIERIGGWCGDICYYYDRQPKPSDGYVYEQYQRSNVIRETLFDYRVMYTKATLDELKTVCESMEGEYNAIWG